MRRFICQFVVAFATVCSLAGLAQPAHAQLGCAGCDSGCLDGSCAPVVDGHGGGSCNGCVQYRPFTEESQPDLFYNFFVPGNGGEAAAAYPAPYPTPNLVGHSYYTYQPLMPHEFLYHHRRTYHQPYNAGTGLNRTKVRWTGTPLRSALHGIHKAFELPR